MYFITLSNSLREWENAPKPSCQLKRKGLKCFSLIKLVLSVFKTCTVSEREMAGLAPYQDVGVVGHEVNGKEFMLFVL